MDPRLFGEFMGTLVLVLIGNGVVANVVLKKTLGSGAGWLTIVFGYGLGVVSGVFVAIACGSSDAHINPAVSLGMLVAGKISMKKFAAYAVVQTAGALVGAVLVWLQFLPHWAETPDGGSKLACFSTGPAIKNTAANFFSEVLGTFLLVLLIASIVKAGPPPGLVPFLVGASVWAIGSGLGGSTGFGINPARDFGPRIAHAILPIPGKGSSEFGYGITVPVLGALTGGALAGVFIMLAHL